MSEDITARSNPLWALIFNAIPSDLQSGSEQKRLVFSQRAQIADAVYAAASGLQQQIIQINQQGYGQQGIQAGQEGCPHCGGRGITYPRMAQCGCTQSPQDHP